MIQHIKLDKIARDQLITIKKATKISTWNVICRWAFLTSIAEKTVPNSRNLNYEKKIEMTWKVFGGEYGNIYWILLKNRCYKDGLLTSDLGENEHILEEFFKLHLNRGIQYLATNRNIHTIEDLFRSNTL